MRPMNAERVILEFARIQRIAEPGTLFPLEDFALDVAARFGDAVNYSGRWWQRIWKLGDLQVDRNSTGHAVRISGRLGWAAESESADVPPPYDDERHSWATDPVQRREGALGLFVVNVESQYLGVTSLFGDLKVPGFCRALEDMLNQTEVSEAARDAARVKREWLVDQVDERGTFEAWVNRMAKVTRVSASFHLPNPRTRDDIEPVVALLNNARAEKGTISVENRDGLDPYGDETVKAAIVMQKYDYGSVTAKGQANDREEKYASAEHPTSDRLEPGPEDPPMTQLSLAGLLVLMMDAVKKRFGSDKA